jgi:hypothetical protein
MDTRIILKCGLAAALLLSLSAIPSHSQPLAQAIDDPIGVECASALEVASEHRVSCKKQFDRCLEVCTKTEMGMNRRRCILDCRQKASNCKSSKGDG